MARQPEYVTKKEFQAYVKYCEKTFKAILKQIKAPAAPKKMRKK